MMNLLTVPFLSTLAAAVVTSEPVSQFTAAPEATVACPTDFKNTVFNSDAARHNASVGYIWNTLQEHSVAQFIAFTPYPLWNDSRYDQQNGEPAPKVPSMDAHQFKMCPAPENATVCLEVITDPNTAPQHMELLNEPDFHTHPRSPQECSDAMQPLFHAKRAGKTNTTFIGPAVANPYGTWLQEFLSICNCSDLLPIIGVHEYNTRVDDALRAVQHVHLNHPEKKLWITEFSPATLEEKCELDENGVIEWMKKAIPRLARTGYVEKVFWNRGTYGVRKDGKCDTSLVNEQGNAKALLQAYQEIC